MLNNYNKNTSVYIKILFYGLISLFHPVDLHNINNTKDLCAD